MTTTIYYIIREASDLRRYFTGYSVNTASNKLECGLGEADDAQQYQMLNEAIAQATALKAKLGRNFQVKAAYDRNLFSRRTVPTDVMWTTEG